MERKSAGAPHGHRIQLVPPRGRGMVPVEPPATTSRTGAAGSWGCSSRASVASYCGGNRPRPFWRPLPWSCLGSACGPRLSLSGPDCVSSLKRGNRMSARCN